MKLKKLTALGLSLVCVASLAAGCGSSDSGSGASESSAKKPITIVSREDGSGTRGAFIELFGVEEEDQDGNKVDQTTTEATIAKSTEVVMTTVSGDEYAIGYSSLGALNDTVKAVKIDGVEATAENIKSGDYTISRPFNIATKGDLSDIAQDFVNYIMSTEGQQIVNDEGYIPVETTESYSSNGATGKVVVAGSSSVTPVMEKLSEAYMEVNSGAEIEVQESDSTTGMTSVSEGTCDIGMASRELKDEETEAGLTATVIAMDGIAVIVNKENELDDLSTETVKAIYTGEITDWNDVSE
ncbi:MAG: substrate-binding domain-containing protein [Clostridiaceae bacterium]|nr:substrate-binding domain-containing protein [Clostridiaceae bacterium]